MAFGERPGEVILQENKNPQQLCMETFAVGRDGTCYLMDPEKCGSQEVETKKYPDENRDEQKC